MIVNKSRALVTNRHFIFFRLGGQNSQFLERGVDYISNYGYPYGYYA